MANTQTVIEAARGATPARGAEEDSRAARGSLKMRGWFEEYRCGCVSDVVKTKRELLGYCAQHGDDRRQIFPYRQPMKNVEQRKSEPRAAGGGCELCGGYKRIIVSAGYMPHGFMIFIGSTCRTTTGSTQLVCPRCGSQRARGSRKLRSTDRR